MELESFTAYWEMHHLVSFEPQVIAEPGSNRTKDVLPCVSFCKLGIPSGLGIAWDCHPCAMVAGRGGHLT